MEQLAELLDILNLWTALMESCSTSDLFEHQLTEDTWESMVSVRGLQNGAFSRAGLNVRRGWVNTVCALHNTHKRSKSNQNDSSTIHLKRRSNWSQ